MKPSKLLLWILLGLLLLLCGCARSIFQSSQLPIEKVDKISDLNMVYALPKGMIHLKMDGSAFTYDTVYTPDPEHYYTLTYLPRGSYEETVNVTLNPELLLSDIKIDSKPQIGAILLKAVDLAREIAKLPIAFARGPEVKNFDVMLDPKVLLDKRSSRDVQELAALRDKLQTQEERVKTLKGKDVKDLKNDEILELQQLEHVDIPALKNQQAEAKNKMAGFKSLANLVSFSGIEDISLTRLFPAGVTQSIASPVTGVKYRPLLPYRLEIQFSNYLFSKIIYLPNEAPVITLDLTRPAFATRVTHLAFSNGVLTQIDLTRPSEILAFATIPVELVKAIAGLPMDLISFKVQNISAQNSLLQAQIAQIQGEIGLLQAQQQLQQLKQPSPPK